MRLFHVRRSRQYFPLNSMNGKLSANDTLAVLAHELTGSADPHLQLPWTTFLEQQAEQRDITSVSRFANYYPGLGVKRKFNGQRN